MDRKILIIGAGTAGCATAIFLRQHGFQVVLVDRLQLPCSTETPKIGESLSPDSAPLLQQLDIWEDFQKAPHLKCYGNISYWHSDKPTHHDFLQHPIGHGWHLDRAVFDQQLLDRAVQSGAELFSQTGLSSFHFDRTQWEIKLQSENEETALAADFLVDASGRNSWLARQLGVDRLYEAEQLALVSYLDISPEFEDTRTLVETVENGWWYSAPIPGNRMTAVFFYPSSQLKVAPEDWTELINQAPKTLERVKAARGELINQPTLTSAHSSILENLRGEGWIAVGDAAMTYDPIAAHGITMALTSARDAAKAIAQHFQEDQEALSRYEAVLWAAFQRYAMERQKLTSTPVSS